MNGWWLLMWVGCHGGEREPTTRPELATSAVEVRAPTSRLTLGGELEPRRQVDLRARFPAYLVERRVDVGSRVQEGEVLVVLSAPERVAERAQAEAELQTAEALARRLRAAGALEGTVAPKELEEAQGKLASISSRLGALRALEHELTVRAPFDGVVTQRGADEGSLVGRSGDELLVELSDLASLRLVVAVPERFAAGARPGLVVPFRSEGDARPREAAVSRTSGLLDGRSRTLAVELDVDNADGALLAGGSVEVLWPTDTGEAPFWVPYTALVRGTEGTWVWVRRDDALVRVDVEEVLREGPSVGLRGALTAGELVVSRGSEDLRPGPWPGSLPP